MITEILPASYDIIMSMNMHDTDDALKNKGVITPCSHLTNYIMSAWKMIITTIHNEIMKHHESDEYKYTMSMTTHRSSMNTIIVNMSDNDNIIRIAAGLIRVDSDSHDNYASIITSYGRKYKLVNFIVNAYGVSIHADDLHEATMLVMSAL